MEQELFTAALGLMAPWRVERSEFDAEAGRLDLFLDFPRGARFACPEPGCPESQCPVHDAEDKTWQHLDFFQYQAHPHERVPRVECPQHGVRQVTVSWARRGSGFTLLFEALLITFGAAMPVACVAAFTGERDTRIWRGSAPLRRPGARQARLLHSGTGRGGRDRRGPRTGLREHRHGSRQPPRAVGHPRPRRRHGQAQTPEDLKAHGGYPEAIGNVTCDMSAAFIAGVRDHLPNAGITFDRFHIMKKLGEASTRSAAARPRLGRRCCARPAGCG